MRSFFFRGLQALFCVLRERDFHLHACWIIEILLHNTGKQNQVYLNFFNRRRRKFLNRENLLYMLFIVIKCFWKQLFFTRLCRDGVRTGEWFTLDSGSRRKWDAPSAAIQIHVVLCVRLLLNRSERGKRGNKKRWKAVLRILWEKNISFMLLSRPSTELCAFYSDTWDRAVGWRGLESLQNFNGDDDDDDEMLFCDKINMIFS